MCWVNSFLFSLSVAKQEQPRSVQCFDNTFICTCAEDTKRFFNVSHPCFYLMYAPYPIPLVIALQIVRIH